MNGKKTEINVSVENSPGAQIHIHPPESTPSGAPPKPPKAIKKSGFLGSMLKKLGNVKQFFDLLGLWSLCIFYWVMQNSLDVL